MKTVDEVLERYAARIIARDDSLALYKAKQALWKLVCNSRPPDKAFHSLPENYSSGDGYNKALDDWFGFLHALFLGEDDGKKDKD